MENNKPKQNYVLNVDEQEVMILGSALGKLPYETVSALITKLQNQIQEQVSANVAAAPEAPAPAAEVAPAPAAEVAPAS